MKKTEKNPLRMILKTKQIFILNFHSFLRIDYKILHRNSQSWSLIVKCILNPGDKKETENKKK